MSELHFDPCSAASVLSAACIFPPLIISFFIGSPIAGAIIGLLGFGGSVWVITVLCKELVIAHHFFIPAGVTGAILGLLSGYWGKYVRLKRSESTSPRE